jgi:hypothetical protein
MTRRSLHEPATDVSDVGCGAREYILCKLFHPEVVHPETDVIEGYIEDRIGESEKSNQRLDKGTRDFEPTQLIRCANAGHCSSPWWDWFTAWRPKCAPLCFICTAIVIRYCVPGSSRNRAGCCCKAVSEMLAEGF